MDLLASITSSQHKEQVVKSLIRELLSRRWWNKSIGLKASSAIFAVIVPLVSITAIPTQVTVDSIFYIASAKSLFSPDFATYYIWYREPGYPLLLSLIHIAGNSALYVQAVQALFMGMSVWMLIYVFRRVAGKTDMTRLQVGLGILFIFNPMFFSYSGNFLQQALFCIILATFAVFVEWSRLLPPRLSDAQLVVLALCLYLIGVLTSIGWLYFSVFPIVLIYLNIFRRRFLKKFPLSQTKNKFLPILARLLAIVILTGLSFAIGRATYAGWEAFKAPYIVSSTDKTSVVNPDAIPSFADPIGIATRFLAVMDLTHVDPYEPQNEIFEEAAMRLRFLHSEWDTAYINPPTTDYAPGYFSLSDPSLIAHSIFSILAPTSQLAYKITYAVFALLTLLLLIRRKWPQLAIALIPMSFIFIHAVNNTPVDRYGIPGYPFAIALLVITISDFVSRNISRA